MKKVMVGIVLILIMVSSSSAWSLHVKESKEIKKTLKFEGFGERRVLFVDNIFGSIDVTGYDGEEVILLAKKTIKGRTKEKIERAKKEVSLDISTKDNSIELYVDGPFRKQDRSCHWEGEKFGYLVKYDFQLKLPKKVNIFLKTVNDGDIYVTNIEGDFTIRNVNGEISVKNIAGSGKAHTVNGEVKVSFTKNPSEDCSFRTVNGDVQLKFPQRPSADFFLKTFNGGIYTDFDVIHLPSTPTKGKRIKGKFIYKSNRFQGVRIGRGGPKIKMDTLNGDLLIVQR
jgi:hypothetical protein